MYVYPFCCTVRPNFFQINLCIIMVSDFVRECKVSKKHILIKKQQNRPIRFFRQTGLTGR